MLARGSPLHILAAAVGGGTREGTQQFIGGSATEGALQPFPLPEIRTVSGADCCPAALPADDGGVVGGPSPTVGPRDALMAEAGAHPVASPLSGSVPLVLPPGGQVTGPDQPLQQRQQQQQLQAEVAHLRQRLCDAEAERAGLAHWLDLALQSQRDELPNRP